MAHGPDHVVGVGDPTLASDQAGYNPIGYHTGTVLAARHVALIASGLIGTGTDDAANRLVGTSSRPPSASRTTGSRSSSAASNRDEPPCRSRIRRLLAAGLGRRCVVPVPLDDARPAPARGSRRARVAPSAPARLAWQVTLTNLRIGEASVDLLFHRWRGTTSAEVLRKVGEVAVTIRL